MTLSDERLREIAKDTSVYFGATRYEGAAMARELLSRRASPHGEAGATVKPLSDDERERCFICLKPFVEGDMVLPDVTEGLGHRECFGNTRDGFVKDIDTGEPLGPDDPLPTGFPWTAWPNELPAHRSLTEALAHCDTLDSCLETFWCITEAGSDNRLLADAAMHAARRIRSALLPSPSVETVWVQQRSLDEVREQGRSEETFLWAEGRADDHVPLYLSAPGSSAGAGDGIPLKLRRYDAMLRAECAYKGPCADKLACDSSSNALHDRHMAALASAPPQREGLEEWQSTKNIPGGGFTTIEVRRIERPQRWNAAKFVREHDAVLDEYEWRHIRALTGKGGE